MPVRSAMSAARRRLLASLTSRHCCWNSASSASAFELAAVGRDRCSQPSPMRAVISSRRGRDCSAATKRRGVTPLVTLQNFSGHSSAKSRSTVSFNSSECSRATPLTVWLPTHGEVGHAHVARPAFVDERQPRHARFVAGKRRAHFVEEAAVDLVDDLEVARQQASRRDRPSISPAPPAAACDSCRQRSRVSSATPRPKPARARRRAVASTRRRRRAGWVSLSCTAHFS